MEEKIKACLEQLFLFYGGDIVIDLDNKKVTATTIGGEERVFPSMINALYDWLEVLYEDETSWTTEIEFILSLSSHVKPVEKKVHKTKGSIDIFGETSTAYAILADNMFLWEDKTKFAK